jgi:hypothetical protein
MATAKNPTAKQIWDTLSKVDVSAHTEDRGGLTYLSWAWAWGVMMEHYPDLQIKWHGQVDGDGIMRDIQVYPGGSSMVNCSVTIGDVKREMWLPVMDYRHKAIANADSRSISDARMRCLTKCFALFGLGHYIYAGEDTPKSSNNGVVPEIKAPTLESEPPKKARPKRKRPAAKKKSDKNYIPELTETATDLYNRGWEPDVNLKFEIKTAIKNDDNEEAVRLIKLLKEAGSTLTKLSDEEQSNGSD